MRTRTLVIVLALAALFFAVTLALRGDGSLLSNLGERIHGRP